jgi:dihydropteroate synthase
MDLTRRGKIMGILNVTPDSFSDGGRHSDVGAALLHARRMIGEGAEIIDVGGESTRPGAPQVTVEEEIARTRPVIAALRTEWDGCISIDTSKAAVAAAALEAGADVVNDVSGLIADPGMAALCAERGCGVVVMHMQGDPRTMQVAPHYGDVVAEVRAFFEERLATLAAEGIDPETICFDPGIGFGKTVEHNLKLLRGLGSLPAGGRPLLLGVSRKSFIGRVLGSADLGDRAWPTVAITASAREAGVMIHRVHEVKPNVHALRMTEAILQGAEFSE